METQRNYKDRLFRLIFQEKKDLLSLYNAVNGTDYDNPEDLEVDTLENAIFMGVKNDISFIFNSDLSLYEHQSTYNPNMPLRNLIYITSLLEKITQDQTIYSSKLVPIANPRFVTFYNGTQEQPERVILKLSDAFEKPCEDPELELKVVMLNINLGKNQELLDKCKLLQDYAIYVNRVRTYSTEMCIEDAVEQAVNECIEEEILKEFLLNYKTEAIHMSIFEYDHEKEMKKIREAEYSVGEENGLKKGREEGLKEGFEKGREKGLEEGLEKGREEGLEKGRKEGLEEGRKEGLEKASAALIKTWQESGLSKHEILHKLMDILSISKEWAETYLKQYWK